MKQHILALAAFLLSPLLTSCLTSTDIELKDGDEEETTASTEDTEDEEISDSIEEVEGDPHGENPDSTDVDSDRDHGP